jgi:hypothetical protein
MPMYPEKHTHKTVDKETAYNKVLPGYLKYLADIVKVEPEQTTSISREDTPEQAVINQLLITMRYAQENSSNSASGLGAFFSKNNSSAPVEQAIQDLSKTDDLNVAVETVAHLFDVLRHRTSSFKSDSFEYIFIQQLSAEGNPATGLKRIVSKMFGEDVASSGVHIGLLNLSASDIRHFKSYPIDESNEKVKLTQGNSNVRDRYMVTTLQKLEEIAGLFNPTERKRI